MTICQTNRGENRLFAVRCEDVFKYFILAGFGVCKKMYIWIVYLLFDLHNEGIWIICLCIGVFSVKKIILFRM